jgi:hypothetical protein
MQEACNACILADFTKIENHRTTTTFIAFLPKNTANYEYCNDKPTCHRQAIANAHEMQFW